MNTKDISTVLEDLPVHSRGVFPADRIPTFWSRPAGLIFNTDPHYKKGNYVIKDLSDLFSCYRSLTIKNN